MLSDEVIDKVIERLVRRIEQGNTYVLEQIGKSIKKIGTLSPSKAQQLVQIMRYGGDYDKITRKLAEITKLNIKDIKKIFEEVAKSDYQFAEQFYKYRNKKYIKWDENLALRNQVDALARITADKYQNLSNTLAFATHDKRGRVVYNSIARTYQNTLDEAILSVGQGKETFESATYRVLKQLVESGIRTVDYESGRSMRLDSAVRMQMQSALRDLHNEMQQQLGKEFEADGVEISVHENPAPDHQEVQGRQFSNQEFYKFQNDEDAVDYQGKEFPAEFEGHDRRSISQYNCYHYIFSIVLGVNKPQYSNEKLQEIIDRNNKGFDFDGKHYTMYEGQQLQRKLELEIRKQKDLQIMEKASGREYMAGEAQNKIRALTQKYKELSDVSGLSVKVERMRVSGYKRSASASKVYNDEINKMKIGTFDITRYTDEIKPTTSDVILTAERTDYIKATHPEVMPWFDKLPDIVNNPDKVYLQMTGKKNSVWVVKDFEGQKIQAIIKINKTTLYQRKELGYKNSVIHMHPVRDKYIESKIRKGYIKELIDKKVKK